ncbi:type II secretion system minor pseudopilin GspI [Erwinia psidii]|uniref:Type II secretion system protein I n=1 Tax=Erwinia psidii TaxID=69224 RepID=A0A3N6SAW1_9GAMM|nr:type II secretion system minor pseudopilin GspI [Erwinia psidii]MCX8958083.1 type II secretion system protein GspI [Erwinia psidii]MCX8962483.1 type II secretion system protein GspI [Erwinia psidii]MCX8966383.1 type II secretion system protein GspI [Erwinia psidii]RQM37063.1 type II secretion system protein GspI [Erwinia psidii]
MKSRGMTLLETMIAMAILSLAGIALMNSDTEKIRNLDRLHEKQLAAWLADNAAAEITLSGGLSAAQKSLRKVQSGNSQFYLSRKSVSTSYEDVQRIQVDVSSVHDRHKIIFSLYFYLAAR